MFRSTNYFLLLPIATMLISMGSSIEIICLDTDVFVYCDFDSDQNSKLLDDHQYVMHCDPPDVTDAHKLRFLCSVGRLNYIPRNVLAKFEAAEVIYISLVWLPTVKMEDFRRNGNMKTLHLQYNQLTQLPAYLFKYTPKIEFVDFHRSYIETIDPNTFAVGVDNLQTIDLSDNQIKTLDGRTFVNVFSLGEINLKVNQMEHIGLRFVQSDQIAPYDSYKNSSLNCLVLPLRNNELPFVNVYQS